MEENNQEILMKKLPEFFGMYGREVKETTRRRKEHDSTIN